MTHHFIAGKDFSKATLNALARKGIYVIGSFCINAQTGEVAYQLSGNGTGKVRSFIDVLAIAKGQ